MSVVAHLCIIYNVLGSVADADFGRLGQPAASMVQETLSRKTFKDEIFQILHRRIIAGNYQPGEWLRQEEIASQLGVSQTPVREALELLVSAGLAERVPYQGVRVLQPSVDEILDAYAARLLTDTPAARLAAAHIGAEEVERLSELVKEMRGLNSLEDLSRLRELNRSLHLGVAAASGNGLLAKMCEMAANAFPDWMLYEAMFRHPERMQASLKQEHEEHRALVRALGEHDGDMASGIAQRHILNLGKDLVLLLGIPAERLQQKEAELLSYLDL
jgi:DNA-binding GntR family transcriptional regulator